MMAVSREETALESLKLAIAAREELERVQAHHGRHHLRFLRDARAAGWSWTRIGDSLGLSEVAVRRYWERNRHAADRIGGSNANNQTPAAMAAAGTPSSDG